MSLSERFNFPSMPCVEDVCTSFNWSYKFWNTLSLNEIFVRDGFNRNVNIRKQNEIRLWASRFKALMIASEDVAWRRIFVDLQFLMRGTVDHWLLNGDVLMKLFLQWYNLNWFDQVRWKWLWSCSLSLISATRIFILRWLNSRTYPRRSIRNSDTS